MRLSRRSFLKVSGFGGLILSINPLLFVNSNYSNFNPLYQYGDYVVVSDFSDSEIKRACWRVMSKQIKETVPLKYRQIEFILKKPIPSLNNPLMMGTDIVGWKTRPLKAA